MKKLFNWISMLVFNSIKNKNLLLVLILFCSCTKNDQLNNNITTIEGTVEIINVDILNLNAAYSEWNYSQMQRITYSNSSVITEAYKSYQSTPDSSRYLVKFKANNKTVEAIATEKVLPGGIKRFTLMSTGGLVYYSFLYNKYNQIAEPKVIREVPLYTLQSFVIGGGATEGQGKLFGCMKKNWSRCSSNWACSMTCNMVGLGANLYGNVGCSLGFALNCLFGG